MRTKGDTRSAQSSAAMQMEENARERRELAMEALKSVIAAGVFPASQIDAFRQAFMEAFDTTDAAQEPVEEPAPHQEAEPEPMQPAGTPLDPNREMQNLAMGYDPDHPSIAEDPGMKLDPFPDDRDWDELDREHRRANRNYRELPRESLVALAKQASAGDEEAMEDLLLGTNPDDMGRRTPEQWASFLMEKDK